MDSVRDFNGSNAGLVSGLTTYTYDGNGNMLSATNTVNTGQNKNITYNLLNLPLVVTVPNGTDTYTYDAAGNKLRMVKVIGGATTNTDYIGGIQYNGSGSADTLSFIQTEEGKAVHNGTTYDYQYYLGDNLGNTRITFNTKKGIAKTIQQDDYYPFGLEILRAGPHDTKNEYLYNKKELQEDFTEYDYGARFYDPVIGRWTSVDPKAELDRRWSPYRYGYDDPLRFTDPDGNIEIDKKTAKKHPGLVQYAKDLQKNFKGKPEAFRKTFKQFSGLSDKQINNFLTYGKGPKVTVANLDKGNDRTNGETILYPEGNGLMNSDGNGKYQKGGGQGLIKLDDDVVKAYEGAKTMGEKRGGELLLESTLFHEGVHYGTGENHSNERSFDEKGEEKGKEFEKAVYGDDVGRYNANRLASPVLQVTRNDL